MEPAKHGGVEGGAGRGATLRLVPAAAEEPQKARPVKLLASDSVEDAAVCVFSASLDHFEANLPAFKGDQSAEAVHQMRVALRRLRAAMGLFKDALFGEALEAARARAKDLGSVLGAARNFDVFHEMLTAAPGEALSDDPGFYALLDALELRRAKAYRAARAELEGPRLEDFLGDFRKAIAERDWRAAAGMSDEGSARAFARETLSRLRKRVLKKTRGLAKRSPEERHAARIALKKARYGAEFFESLFDADAAAEFSAALAKSQDGLGAFNDIAMAGRLLDDVDAESATSLRPSGFVRGWFAHAAQEGAAHARKTEKKLKKLKPFWS
ncbi:CHAD domain-containing protein [Methylocystis echinoides]|uniref:CHAD domain-containing protein n=1 Tax=Methylocystis echinoides TaxID=29468 RepID=UPI0034197988